MIPPKRFQRLANVNTSSFICDPPFLRSGSAAQKAIQEMLNLHKIVPAFCVSLIPVVMPLVNLYFSNSDSTWRNYCKISKYLIFMIGNAIGNYICL